MAINAYAGLSAQQKTFYQRVLLERLLPKLVFMKYGQPKPVPKNEGATVNFRRFNSFTPTTTPLTEGVTPTGETITYGTVTATIQGYGKYVIITDQLDMMGIDDNITEATEALGENAGESLDMVVRDVVAAGTNVFYAGSAVSRDQVTASDILTGAMMRRVRQVMARNNVKPVKGAGAYLAFVHPDVAYDIMGDSAWTNANQYAGSQKIFDGEIGKLYGVRYIETTMAPIFVGEGAAGCDVYGTIVIGDGAYGVPDIAGSSKPEIIVKPLGSGGSEDPLNQRASVAWKAYLAAARLNELCILRVESAASVGALA